ncbi:PTTG1IP family member 2, partial [Erinaceus europaeus]|uniref:PTTG1IP family member 2 n=1 Tax=Erinaceus europaeus TaxID=9365 RepID=A0ABM3WU51_ERIEU
CFWCSDEKSCNKYCFPYSECRVASIFWLNCRVDMFGILMIVLIILIVVGVTTYCCIYHHYMHSRNPVFVDGRRATIYNHRDTLYGSPSPMTQCDFLQLLTYI